jgi:hypothetical protein
MTKIYFREAVEKTCVWLEKNKIDPAKVTSKEFSAYISDWCKKFGYQIN